VYERWWSLCLDVRYLFAFFHDTVPYVFAAFRKILQRESNYLGYGTLRTDRLRIRDNTVGATYALSRRMSSRNCIRTSNGSIEKSDGEEVHGNSRVEQPLLHLNQSIDGMEESDSSSWNNLPIDILLIIMEYASYRAFLETPLLFHLASGIREHATGKVYNYGARRYMDEGISVFFRVCRPWNAVANSSSLSPRVIAYFIELRPLQDAPPDIAGLLELIMENTKTAQVELHLQWPPMASRIIPPFIRAIAPYVRRLALSEVPMYGQQRNLDRRGRDEAEPRPSIFFPKLLEFYLYGCSHNSPIRKLEDAPRLLRLTIKDDDLSLVSELQPYQLHLGCWPTAKLQSSSFAAFSHSLGILHLASPVIKLSVGEVLYFPALQKLHLEHVEGNVALNGLLDALEAPKLQRLCADVLESHVSDSKFSSDSLSLSKYPTLTRLSLGGLRLCCAMSLSAQVSCSRLQELWMSVPSPTPECFYCVPLNPIGSRSQPILARNIYITLYGNKWTFLKKALSETQFPRAESLTIQWSFPSIGSIIDNSWHEGLAMPRLKRLLVKNWSYGSAAYAGQPLRVFAITPDYFEPRLRHVLDVGTVMWTPVMYETPNPEDVWDFPTTNTIIFKSRDRWGSPAGMPMTYHIGQLLLSAKPPKLSMLGLTDAIKDLFRKPARRGQKLKNRAIRFPSLTKVVVVVELTATKFIFQELLECLQSVVEDRERVGVPIREIACSLLLEHESEKNWFNNHKVEWKHLSSDNESTDLLFFRDAVFAAGYDEPFKMWIGRTSWN
jgi:hypothetical protein